MAISISVLQSAGMAASTSARNTSSLTAAPNSVVIVFASTISSAGYHQVSGMGLTWPSLGDYAQSWPTSSNTDQQFALWTASVGPSGVTGTITFTPVASSSSSLTYTILNVTGLPDPANTKYVQFNWGRTSGTSLSISLNNASGDTANRCLAAFWSHTGTSTSFTPRTNWTEVGSTVNSFTPVLEYVETQWRSDAFEGTASVTTPGSLSADWAGIVLELGTAVTRISANDSGTLTDAVGLNLVTKSSSDTGHGTDAAGSRLVILSASDSATSADNVVSRLVRLSDGDATSLHDYGGVGVRFAWMFTTPSWADWWQIRGDLFVTINEGLTVLKNGSQYTVVDTPLPEQITAADIVYLGGRTYEVSNVERAALTGAGFTVVLTPVPL